MGFHRQGLSIIITSVTHPHVDTIPLIVDQRLHSVWELLAKAVNIIIVMPVLHDALQCKPTHLISDEAPLRPVEAGPQQGLIEFCIGKPMYICDFLGFEAHGDFGLYNT